MPEFRNLAGESGGNVYDTFMAAFADYSVPITMSRADFDENNERRGFDASISLGAYEGERLVGFILNGRGTWQGRSAAYDLGTGVLPEARGAGLSGILARKLIEFLPSRGLELYVLEVIRDNLPAFKTYEKAGFGVTRLLECPDGRFADSGRPAPAGLELVDLPGGAAFPRAEVAAFRDWEPSWQNSDDAIRRTPGRLVILGARFEGRLAGCLVASPKGTIWQFAVAPARRGRGIGSALLRELARRAGPELRYINVQADDAETLRFLAARGIGAGVGQYEMTRVLSPS
ncbi:MAG: GNAT family N-acetyltransferase [Spirochaetaceae bacterium]|nr:GNAT family N-acetyltransferase [Spirochaetaceae bacterium]